MTARIVGWAHTPFGKFDTETVESLVVRVATDALADAGISAGDVDEIVLGHFNAGFSPQDFTASLVLQGALHEELFVQPGCSGEMFFIFAKIHPFLKDLRQKMDNPDAWSNIEKVATGSKTARKRLERVAKNIENRRKAMAKMARKG